jgi:type IV pilus assembly protein PilA
MKFWNKMKKNSKGFTLVEIIVVLVILAVLAAFTIPTMLGFVNESKGKALIAEAREVYVAAQATATEYRAGYDTTDLTDANLQTALGSRAVVVATKGSADADDKASFTMQTYLESDYTIRAATDAADLAAAKKTASKNPYWEVTLDTTNAAKVDKVVYVRDGYTITITAGGGSTVEKND